MIKLIKPSILYDINFNFFILHIDGYKMKIALLIQLASKNASYLSDLCIVIPKTAIKIILELKYAAFVNPKIEIIDRNFNLIRLGS